MKYTSGFTQTEPTSHNPTSKVGFEFQASLRRCDRSSISPPVLVFSEVVAFCALRPNLLFFFFIFFLWHFSFLLDSLSSEDYITSQLYRCSLSCPRLALTHYSHTHNTVLYFISSKFIIFLKVEFSNA